jgi:hypothetical protein
MFPLLPNRVGSSNTTAGKELKATVIGSKSGDWRWVGRSWGPQKFHRNKQAWKIEKGAARPVYRPLEHFTKNQVQFYQAVSDPAAGTVF